MSMPPGLRKFALTAHVTCSVGWLGAVAVFLALAVIGLSSPDAQTVRGAYLVMEAAARFVLVPFAFASLLTGLVMSLGTTWGLFRHYWVLFKRSLPPSSCWPTWRRSPSWRPWRGIRVPISGWCGTRRRAPRRACPGGVAGSHGARGV